MCEGVIPPEGTVARQFLDQNPRYVGGRKTEFGKVSNVYLAEDDSWRWYSVDRYGVIRSHTFYTIGMAG